MRLPNPFRRAPFIPSVAQVLRAIEATPALREAVVDSFGYMADPDASHSAGQLGSFYTRGVLYQPRDIPKYENDRAIRLSYLLADTNPIAKRIVAIIRDYVIGSGITVTADIDAEEAASDMSVDPLKRADLAAQAQAAAEDEAAVYQAVIDRFWNDHINNMDLKLPERVRTLSITGEQCWPVAVDDKGGVRLGYVDPAMIEGILCDAGNADHPVAVLMGASVVGGAKIVLKIIQPQDDPNLPEYGRLVGATPGEAYEFAQINGALTGQYSGSCFFFHVGGVSGSHRGRSDLLAVINYLDAYEAFMLNEIDRMALQKSFVYDVTLTGADQTAVDAWALRHKALPKPGTVNVHNDSEIWAEVTPGLHEADAQVGGDMILSVIATGSGITKTWLNALMDVNRATATSMPEPTFKFLEERQRYVKYMISDVVRFVLDQAEIAGIVPTRDALTPEPWPITVHVPELVREDVMPNAQSLSTVAPALAALVASDIIDEQVAQDVAASFITNAGIEVDVPEMRKRIAADKQRRQAQASAMVAGNPMMGAPNAKTAQNGAVGAQGMNGNGKMAAAVEAAVREAIRRPPSA